MDELNIPMPGEEEKRRSVAQILDAGLPKRTGLWRELSGAMRTAGIGTMFFGVWDCLALSALIWVLCIFPSSFLSELSGNSAPAMLIFSPAFYASLSLLSSWKDQQSGLPEWTRSFKMSSRLLMALRLMCFGAASVLLSVPANAVIWRMTGETVPLVWLLVMSLTGLFLYAALSLACMRIKNRIAGQLAAPAIWLALGLVPFIWRQAAEFIAAMPAVVFCLLVPFAIALYIIELRHFCRQPEKGGAYYAFG